MFYYNDDQQITEIEQNVKCKRKTFTDCLKVPAFGIHKGSNMFHTGVERKNVQKRFSYCLEVHS